MLNKFNDNMKNNMNLYKEFKYKKNEFNTKLDKLDNDAKKLKNYIRENNDKIFDRENKLDNLLLEYNQSNKEFIKIKDNNDLKKIIKILK